MISPSPGAPNLTRLTDTPASGLVATAMVPGTLAHRQNVCEARLLPYGYYWNDLPATPPDSWLRCPGRREVPAGACQREDQECLPGARPKREERRLVSTRSIVRRIAVGTIVGLAAVCLGAGPAFAASPHGQTVTETDHIHGTFDEPNATNPCTGDAFQAPDGGAGIQFTGNLVNHVTYFTNSDEVWATFTETGKVVGTDVDTGVIYTGRATVWGNLNMNERNQNSEFTLTIHVTGSDGSTITGHETTVFVVNGNGTVTVSFDKLNLTCG